MNVGRVRARAIARNGRCGRLVRSLGAVVFVSTLLGACGGSSRKIEPLPEATGPTPARILWQARVGSGREFDFVPAVVDDSIFAAARDGTVVRLDASNGRERWRVSMDAPLTAGVGANANQVAVGTAGGEVIVLDAASGKTLWRTRVSSELLGPPLVLEDVVIARTSDTRVFALDAADGKRRWLYQRAAPALVVRTSVGAINAGNLIYSGFPGGKLVALNRTNGGVRWEGTVASPKGATEVERVSDVVGFPWLLDREICAVAYQGRAACFDANTGAPLWTKEISSGSGLTGDRRVVVVSEAQGAVLALERSTGNNLWRQTKLGGRTLSAPLTLDGLVAFGDNGGLIHFLRREDGEYAGRVITDGSPIVAPPLRIASGFLVQTRAGSLYAIGI